MSKRTELLWVAVDLDNTLAESIWPEPGVGAPIGRNLIKVRELKRAGWKVVIHSARGWEDYEIVESWLLEHEIPFDKIVLGKLLAALYVDDRARHADEADWRPERKIRA